MTESGFRKWCSALPLDDLPPRWREEFDRWVEFYLDPEWSRFTIREQAEWKALKALVTEMYDAGEIAGEPTGNDWRGEWRNGPLVEGRE